MPVNPATLVTAETLMAPSTHFLSQGNLPLSDRGIHSLDAPDTDANNTGRRKSPMAPESQEITSAPGNKCDLKYNQRSRVRETKNLCYITTYWITKERPPVTTLLNPCACLLSYFNCVQLFVTLWTVDNQESPGDSPGKNTRVGCHVLLSGSS